MPEERQETMRVTLMGPPRVLAGTDGPEVMLGDGGKELLALLVVGTLLLPPDGVWREIKDSQGVAGYEVEREWLVETLCPGEYAQQNRRQAARDRVGYLLDRMHPRGILPPPLPFRLFPTGESRERGLARVTWRHLGIDLAELLEAARNPHGPASQEKIMALAARPLLEGMAYPWLQRPEFQRTGAHLDAAYLAALCGRADSLLVLMENARADGRANEVYSHRTRVLPLLDRAAERLQGTAGRLDAPELEALRPFPLTLESLRARASYPSPTSPQAEAADAVPSPPNHNLPSPVSSFVGREQERQDIRDLLTSGRLVTLTGMGGCGKTRLAVQAAWELLGEWDNVRLVELAALTNPDRVPQAIATALGVTEQKGITVRDALTAFLQDKRTLLLLDNCEHLLLNDSLEVDDCGTFAAALLHACPTLSILATSRKPLNIDGEHLCPLSPLPFPAPDFLPVGATDPVAALLGYDAAQLFVDRVFQFRRFALEPENVGPVAAICAALDGIPLSLELAAARMKALSLEEITKRLSEPFGLLTHGRRESPARHKTLRAVIDWSYDLLTEPERLLLCRLSVFAGGWALDAAEAVGASEDLPRADVLSLLESLVDKSLVIADLTASPGRYRMLVTVRQYAEDRLRERGEWEETRRRHREFYFHLAEKAYHHLKESDLKHWLDRLDADVDNLRATVTSYSESQSADEEWLRLTAWLSSFWRMRGYLSEGLSHLQKALAQVEDASASTRALAFEGAGNLSHHLGDYESARSLLKRGLELMRGIDDDEGVAKILTTLGALEFGMQELAEARVRFQETLEIFRRTNNTRRIPTALVNLAAIALHQKDLIQARSLCVEGLEIFRQIKDEHNIAHSLYLLANVEQEEGSRVEAERLLQESLRIFRAWKDQWRCILVLETMTEVAAAQGQYKRTGQLWGAAEALRQRLGTPVEPGILDQYNQILSGVGEKFGTTSFEAALAEGRAMSLEQAVAFALGEDAA